MRCSYCKREGCNVETCPDRLEDKWGVASDYRPDGEKRTDDDREIRTDGGSVFTWDEEDCPRDDCEGDLQQQDEYNVMCLSCEGVWTHWKDETEHILVTVDHETVARKPRVATDGGQPTDDLVRELLELVETWRDDADIFLDPDDENVSDGERGAALQQHSCAEQIEELVERYTDTTTDEEGSDR